MQRVISDFVTKELFTELLLESGKYKASYEIPEEELVYLEFNNLDHDAQIKIESHYLNLMNSGAINVQEFRKEIGKRPMTDEEMSTMGKWEESRLPPHQVEASKLAGEVSMISSKASAASKATSSTSASTSKGSHQTKSAGAAKSSKAITSPKNQYSDSLVDSILVIRDSRSDVAEQLKAHIEPMLDVKDFYLDNSLYDIYTRIADTICSLGKDDLEENISDLITQLYMEVGEICQPS